MFQIKKIFYQYIDKNINYSIKELIKITNEDNILRLFVHYRFVLNEKTFNETFFLIIYFLLINENLNLKTWNDFKQNYFFKRIIIKYIINLFFKKSNINTKFYHESIIQFVNNIENEDLINYKIYINIGKFILYNEMWSNKIKIFKKYLSFFNLEKKFNFNLYLNENNLKQTSNDYNLVIINKLNNLKFLDDGVFGNVYIYKNNIIKCNKFSNYNLNLIKETFINKLLYNKCNNIIRLVKSYYLTEKNLVCGEYEKANYNFKYYLENIFINEDNKFIKKIILINQILEVVNCLHFNNINHLDLNWKNIVIFKKDLKIKLIDFGKSSFKLNFNIINTFNFKFIINLLDFYNYLADWRNIIILIFKIIIIY